MMNTNSNSINTKQVFADFCILFFATITIIVSIVVAVFINIKMEVFPAVNKDTLLLYSCCLLAIEFILVIMLNGIAKLIFKEQKHKLQVKILSFIWLLIIGLFINRQVIGYVNMQYSPSDSDNVTIYTTVNYKRFYETTHKHSTTPHYEMTFQGWLPNQNELILEVDESVYNKYVISDIVAINVKKGLLGIDFINDITKMKKISKSDFVKTAKFPMTESEADKYLIKATN